MDLGIIIAIVGSAISICGVVFAMMFWVRSESNSLRSEASADRRDIVNLIIAIKEDIQAIQMEMRDFHGRLCAIEERRGK